MKAEWAISPKVEVGNYCFPTLTKTVTTAVHTHIITYQTHKELHILKHTSLILCRVI